MSEEDQKSTELAPQNPNSPVPQENQTVIHTNQSPLRKRWHSLSNYVAESAKSWAALLLVGLSAQFGWLYSLILKNTDVPSLLWLGIGITVALFLWFTHVAVRQHLRDRNESARIKEEDRRIQREIETKREENERKKIALAEETRNHLATIAANSANQDPKNQGVPGEKLPILNFAIGTPEFGNVDGIDALYVWIKVWNEGLRTTLSAWTCTAIFDREVYPGDWPPDGNGAAAKPDKGLIITDRGGSVRVTQEDFLLTKLEEHKTLDKAIALEGWMAFTGLECPEVQIFAAVTVTCFDGMGVPYPLPSIQRPPPVHREPSEDHMKMFDLLTPKADGTMKTHEEAGFQPIEDFINEGRDKKIDL